MFESLLCSLPCDSSVKPHLPCKFNRKSHIICGGWFLGLGDSCGKMCGINDHHTQKLANVEQAINAEHYAWCVRTQLCMHISIASQAEREGSGELCVQAVSKWNAFITRSDFQIIHSLNTCCGVHMLPERCSWSTRCLGPVITKTVTGSVSNNCNVNGLHYVV